MIVKTMPPVGNLAARESTDQIAISVRGVKKDYGHAKVLDTINLDIPRASRVVICGRSGCGKSTLLRCLNGLETPSSGEIRVDGQLVTGATPRELRALRSRIGMVFQHFGLYPHLTVMDNITLAPRKVKGLDRDVARHRAQDLLEQVGLGGFEAKFPTQLSGGQQQRVAIARALAMEPAVMLFDEPTSALDPETVRGVLNVMRELTKSTITMVIVTHEMSFARDVADEILFMDKGVIAERGTPDKLFGSPETSAAKEFFSLVSSR